MREFTPRYRADYPNGQTHEPARTAPRQNGFRLVEVWPNSGDYYVADVDVTPENARDQFFGEYQKRHGRHLGPWTLGDPRDGFRRWDTVTFEAFGHDEQAPRFYVYDADAGPRGDGSEDMLVLVSCWWDTTVRGPGVTRERIRRATDPRKAMAPAAK